MPKHSGRRKKENLFSDPKAFFYQSTEKTYMDTCCKFETFFFLFISAYIVRLAPEKQGRPF